jgi:hypothetical protein
MPFKPNQRSKMKITTATRIARNPFNTFPEIVLQHAAKGLNKKDNGLNKKELIVALLEINKTLDQPHVHNEIKHMKSDELRTSRPSVRCNALSTIARRSKRLNNMSCK